MFGTGNHTPPSGTQETPEDNTSSYVMAQVAVYVATGLLISPEIARAIAAYWQAPGNAFSAFASTGTILPELLPEIRGELENYSPGEEWDQLNALFDYVAAARDSAEV